MRCDGVCLAENSEDVDVDGDEGSSDVSAALVSQYGQEIRLAWPSGC